MQLAGDIARPAAQDWPRLVARARVRRRAATAFLYAVLILGSLPIVVPYLWLFTVALSGRTGAGTAVLWLTLAILMPALVAWLVLRIVFEDARRRRRFELALAAVTLIASTTIPGVATSAATADCKVTSRSPRFEPIASTAVTGGRSAQRRPIVTATSANCSGIGAAGLCTVTSTEPTLASARQRRARRSARRSSRSTGSPRRIAARATARVP